MRSIQVNEKKIDPKVIQQISFTGNLNKAESSTMFFITEEAKATLLVFQKKQLKHYNLFCFDIIFI